MPRARRLTSQGPDNVMVTARGTIRLTQQISTPSPMQGELSASRDRRSEIHRNEVTDIIPFNEFGKLDDWDFSDNAFNKEAQVLRAPELDDLDDTDDLRVMELDGPSETERSVERRVDPYRRDLHRRRPDAESPTARGGQHRRQLTGPTRGRVLIGAMA